MCPESSITKSSNGFAAHRPKAVLHTAGNLDANDHVGNPVIRSADAGPNMAHKRRLVGKAPAADTKSTLVPTPLVGAKALKAHVDAAGAVSGMVPETAPSMGVCIASGCCLEDMMELQVQIIKNLPRNLQVFVLSPEHLVGYRDELLQRTSSRKLVWIDADVDDSSWTRDFCPIVVVNGRRGVRLVEFSYEPQLRPGADNAAKALARHFGQTTYECPLVLEGGNLMVGEAGTLFVTDKVVRSNPDHSVHEIETELKEALGVRDVEWLPRLPKEKTGHVDMYAKIINRNTVFLSSSDDAKQQAMLDGVEKVFRARGICNVVRLMTPDPLRSYTNSLILNGIAFVPAYVDPGIKDTLPEEYRRVRELDLAAARAYRQAGFKVVSINVRKLAAWQGVIHCATMQLSAVLGNVSQCPA